VAPPKQKRPTKRKPPDTLELSKLLDQASELDRQLRRARAQASQIESDKIDSQLACLGRFQASAHELCTVLMPRKTRSAAGFFPHNLPPFAILVPKVRK